MQRVLEYEQHATECRKMAADAKTAQLKREMEDMAEVWDRLASERRQGIVENNPDQT
jgi:hypothetical protein